MPIQTCNIVGTLYDSGGLAVGGTIKVSLDAPVVDDSTTPDSIILVTPRTFTIPNTGVIDIDLPITEPSNVTAFFQVTPTGGGYFEFRAYIPNAATVEFGSLIPTGISNDRLATGSLRIAKEILVNDTLKPYLVSGLGIYRQVDTPTIVENNEFVWIKIPDGLIFTRNTANTQWRSATQQAVVYGTNIDATTTFYAPIVVPDNYSFLYLEKIFLKWTATAPSDGSNRYVFQPGYKSSSSSSLTPIGTSAGANSFPTSVLGTRLYTPNLTLDSDNDEFFGVTVTKNGSPGTINFSATFSYRYLYDP